MRYADRLREIVAANAPLMSVLADIETANLPDSCLAAGTIRGAVWDILHGRPPNHDWADLDVLFFDAADLSKQRDAAAEAALAALAAGLPWEARNQARMHVKAGRSPYRDTEDGIRNFSETPTAIGVRLRGGYLDVIAPHGLDDLFAMIVRPVFTDDHTMAHYRARMAAKQWPARWPQVRVLGL